MKRYIRQQYCSAYPCFCSSVFLEDSNRLTVYKLDIPNNVNVVATTMDSNGEIEESSTWLVGKW